MLAVTLTVIKLFFFILGCGKLWVADGQWKLMFAHCMMKRKVGISITIYLQIKIFTCRTMYLLWLR